MKRYLAELYRWNKAINLTTVKPDKAQELLVEPSHAMLEFLQTPNPLKVFDIGSGGGIPAIILAIYLPQHNFTLVESNGKKSNFLVHVSSLLGLENVRVSNIRVEEFLQSGALQKTADVVTARAVNRQTVSSAAQNLLKEGGTLIMHRSSKSALPCEALRKTGENRFVECFIFQPALFMNNRG